MQKLFKHWLMLGALCVCACGAALIAPTSISAQTTTELDLSFSPPVTYLGIKPGETKILELKLKNSGSRNLKVELELGEFEADGVSGQPKLKFDSGFPYLKAQDPAWNWHQPHALKSGETATIKFVLAVPESVPLKESHLTILAKASQVSDLVTAKSSLTGGSGQVAGLIGSNLIVAVADSNANLSKLELFNWKAPHFVDSLRGIQVTGLIKNQGQQAGPVIGKASLVGPNGQLLKSWLLYPDMVLPGTTRGFRAIDTTTDPSADPALWLSQPNVKLEPQLSYQPSWLLGKYSLKVQLFKQSYTDAQPVVSETYSIIALPFGILIAVIGLPFLYWLVTQTRLQMSRKLKQQAKET